MPNFNYEDISLQTRKALLLRETPDVVCCGWLSEARDEAWRNAPTSPTNPSTVLLSIYVGGVDYRGRNARVTTGVRQQKVSQSKFSHDNGLSQTPSHDNDLSQTSLVMIVMTRMIVTVVMLITMIMSCLGAMRWLCWTWWQGLQ